MEGGQRERKHGPVGTCLSPILYHSLPGQDHEHSADNMNETVIAFWNWTSISVTEEETPTESLEDIFTLDISIIIVLSLSLVSIIFCCVLQRLVG